MEKLEKVINEQRISYINSLFNTGEITYGECEYLKLILKSYNNLIRMKNDLIYEDEITNMYKIYEIDNYLKISSQTLNKYNVLRIDYEYVKALNKAL